ncbi:UNVERIFIED_CONTAM: hypothetical protein GTU68_050612, partial [Idotea baltica]|nr:hypothetical protein [Idotea baltica]
KYRVAGGIGGGSVTGGGVLDGGIGHIEVGENEGGVDTKYLEGGERDGVVGGAQELGGRGGDGIRFITGVGSEGGVSGGGGGNAAIYIQDVGSEGIGERVEVLDIGRGVLGAERGGFGYIGGGRGGGVSVGEEGGGGSRYSGGPVACSPGLVDDGTGTCVEPEVVRSIFVFTSPTAKPQILPPPSIPQPRIDYDVVFVRTPEQQPGAEPIIIPPPEKRTIVYVLTKNGGGQQQIIEVPAGPGQPPEVFYVNYNEGDNPSLANGLSLQDILSQQGEQGQVLGGGGFAGGLGGTLGGRDFVLGGGDGGGGQTGGLTLFEDILKQENHGQVLGGGGFTGGLGGATKAGDVLFGERVEGGGGGEGGVGDGLDRDGQYDAPPIQTPSQSYY